VVLSGAVARGLVVTVVAVDVAMALAGVWLVRRAAAQPFHVTLPGPSRAAEPSPPPEPPTAPTASPTPPPPSPPRDRRRAGSTAAEVIVASPAAAPDAGPPDAAPPMPDAAPADLTTVIRAKIDAQRAAIQGCQAELPDAPSGRIDIHLTVLPEGDVAEVRVVKNDTGSDPLGGCLVRLISGWRFPGPPHDAIEYVWPFVFTSTTPAASP
jgi:hypothetical protein